MQLEIVAKVSGKAYNRGENMGQKEKLIKKLMSKPKDFTFAEAETLLNYFDYVRSNKDKWFTSNFYQRGMSCDFIA